MVSTIKENKQVKLFKAFTDQVKNLERDRCNICSIKSGPIIALNAGKDMRSLDSYFPNEAFFHLCCQHASDYMNTFNKMLAIKNNKKFGGKLITANEIRDMYLNKHPNFS